MRRIGSSAHIPFIATHDPVPKRQTNIQVTIETDLQVLRFEESSERSFLDNLLRTFMFNSNGRKGTVSSGLESRGTKWQRRGGLLWLILLD